MREGFIGDDGEVVGSSTVVGYVVGVRVVDGAPAPVGSTEGDGDMDMLTVTGVDDGTPAPVGDGDMDVLKSIDGD